MFREDINVVGVPLTAITNATYTDARQRQLFKNIIYVGALSVLLDIDPEEIKRLFGEQFKGKEKLLDSNVKALNLGRDWAKQHLDPDAVKLKVRRADNVGDRIFVEGNNAAALGAVYGGATVCAWYPITPSSSLAEAFQTHCKRLRHDKETGKAKYAIVQAEDELASIGIVIGAGWNGSRAFTSTSGPGISLMTEFIGLASFAEVPAVIVNVQRGGPSTGMPTRTQQSDLLSCAYASNGDTKHVLLFPEDPKECFDFTADALDLADRLQTPVFVMTDLDIGMNHRLCKPFEWDDERAYDRGKVMTAEPSSTPARISAAISTSTATASPSAPIPARIRRAARIFTRGTTKDEYARYSEEGAGLCAQHGAAAEEVRHRRQDRAAAAALFRAQADALRRDLFRLDQPGHGRGARPSRGRRQPRQRAARARLPVRPVGRGLHPRARPACSWSSRTATASCAPC